MTYKPASRVTLQKSADGAPATPAVTAPRPTTVTAAAVALILAGLLSIVAALTLFGLHDYLVKTGTKNNPPVPLTSSVITSTGNAFSAFLKSDLTAHPALASTSVAARATDAQNWVTNHLPKSHVQSSDISSQASKMHDAVNSSLSGVTGNSLSAQQITNQASRLTSTFTKNLTDLMNGQAKHLSHDEIVSQANNAPKAALPPNVIVLVVLGLVAAALWRGKYWSRWAVLGVWILATIGGTYAGISGLLGIGAAIPGSFKTAVVLASLAMLAAVILVNLRSSTAWFDAHRPAGAAQRPGLFGGPRSTPPRRVEPAPASSTAAKPPVENRTSAAAADRAKAKQRASADAVARGAELARSRAKAASKSRRTGA